MSVDPQEEKPEGKGKSTVEISENLPKVSGVTIDLEKGVITLKIAGDAAMPDKGNDG